MNKIFLSLILLGLISQARAEDTIEDGRMWLTLSHDYHINERWRLNLHLQPRWRQEGMSSIKFSIVFQSPELR